jgi:hypothetical protein
MAIKPINVGKRYLSRCLDFGNKLLYQNNQVEFRVITIGTPINELRLNIGCCQIRQQKTFALRAFRQAAPL